MDTAANSFSHGIIGAAGSMGTALRSMLSDAGTSVVGIDAAWDSKLDLTGVRSCDAIWLAVPRKEVAVIVADLGQLQPSQVVVDICSVKVDTPEIIARTGAIHLSLHPMHGPHIRRDRQKWFLIGLRDSVPPPARQIVTMLESFGITFLEIDSSREHDYLMGVLLGIKEITTLLIDRLIATYADACGQPVPTIADLIDRSSPVANAVYGAYVHTVLRSGNDLRRELVDAPPECLRETAARALRTLADDLCAMDLEREFSAQRSRVESEIEEVRQDAISNRINAWFEDVSADVARRYGETV